MTIYCVTPPGSLTRSSADRFPAADTACLYCPTLCNRLVVHFLDHVSAIEPGGRRRARGVNRGRPPRRVFRRAVAAPRAISGVSSCTFTPSSPPLLLSPGLSSALFSAGNSPSVTFTSCILAVSRNLQLHAWFPAASGKSAAADRCPTRPVARSPRASRRRLCSPALAAGRIRCNPLDQNAAGLVQSELPCQRRRHVLRI